MKKLPKLVYEYIDLDPPAHIDFFLGELGTAEYNPRTNQIKIYYSHAEILPFPQPFHRFTLMVHEFIHWLLPCYQSGYPLNMIGIPFHVFNELLDRIIRALYDRDKGWIFPYGKDAKVNARTIERGDAKGLKALFRDIYERCMHAYFDASGSFMSELRIKETLKSNSMRALDNVK